MDDDDDLGIDPADVDRIRRIIAELDPADLERIAPPDDVWNGIEASVAAMEARRPPSPATSSPQLVVEYTIDAHDVLIGVGADWAAFADDNWAPELAAPATDRSLWSYIDPGPIAELWRLVVGRVRAERRAVRVPFRCDAPHARRWFEMTIAPGPDGEVQFRSALAFEESRTPVALLDPSVERDVAAEAVPLCSWCGRGQHGARWLDVEDLLRASRLLESAALPPVAYGICGSCRDEMSAELRIPDRVGGTPA